MLSLLNYFGNSLGFQKILNFIMFPLQDAKYFTYFNFI